jgi:hypothetical protein
VIDGVFPSLLLLLSSSPSSSSSQRYESSQDRCNDTCAVFFTSHFLHQTTVQVYQRKVTLHVLAQIEIQHNTSV